MTKYLFRASSEGMPEESYGFNVMRSFPAAQDDNKWVIV